MNDFAVADAGMASSQHGDIAIFAVPTKSLSDRPDVMSYMPPEAWGCARVTEISKVEADDSFGDCRVEAFSWLC